MIDMNEEFTRQLLSLKNKIPDDVEMYLFGSFLRTKQWNDIDLLFLYSDIESPAVVRETINKRYSKYPLHLIFMTKTEELELSFIKTTNAKRL